MMTAKFKLSAFLQGAGAATVALSLLAPSPRALADVLEMKDGQLLTGKYQGGTPGTLRFETDAGVQVIEIKRALALTFSQDASTATAQEAQPPTPSTPPAAKALTVNAGTPLLVRLLDPVSTRDAQGKRFSAKLESDVVVNGSTVIKAGTKVYGRVRTAEQAGRYVGRSTLDLSLTEIAVGPSLVPIVTGTYTQTGERSAGKAARGAAAGAAIGAIADGEEGAGKGAAIGAVASGVRKGQTLTFTPGTLLEFALQQPATIQILP